MTRSYHWTFIWKLASLALLIVMLTLVGIAQAQPSGVHSWNGNGFSNLYTDASNWTPTGVPDTTSESAAFIVNATVLMPDDPIMVRSLDVLGGEINFRLDFFSQASFWEYTSNSMTVITYGGPTTRFTLTNGRMIDNGGLDLGTYNQASLNLVNTTLETGVARLGGNSGSTGTLSIDAFSDWFGAGTQVIGAGGSGVLNIKSGYKYVFGSCCSSKLGHANTSAAVLGQEVGGSGVATVHGFWESGNIIVGDAGSGEVNILSNNITTPSGNPNVTTFGKLQSVTASIAAQPGSSGSVSVSGYGVNSPLGSGFSNSEWDIAGSLAVGGTSTSAGGTGRLEIGQHNVVSVESDMRIWQDGTLSTSEFSDLSITGTAHLAGKLEFVPPSPFVPHENDEFDVLSAAGGIVGTFDSTMLPPLPSGFGWSVEYNATDVKLKVIPGFSADFDHDGDVDGHDFLVWQRNPSVGNLSDWQTQYGMGAGTSPTPISSVPEPASILLLAMGLLSMNRVSLRQTPHPSTSQEIHSRLFAGFS